MRPSAGVCVCGVRGGGGGAEWSGVCTEEGAAERRPEPQPHLG